MVPITVAKVGHGGNHALIVFIRDVVTRRHRWPFPVDDG
ncbi:hypothetical protein UF75_2967 [Desulfosporosinus sp. I2]|nr:hypothetical protein UF75_2967 [Desulfosporosinus sp. I2]